MTLARARLRDVDARTGAVKHDVPVQFNPETLKVAYTNQVSEGGKASSGGEQHVGSGATRLSVQLWFDVTAIADGDPPHADVREITEDILYFLKPQGPDNKAPPLLRFEWGTFSFEGVVESMEESLEFFSPSGVPLRASVTLGLSQPRIQSAAPGASPGGAAGPGTRALTPAPAGVSLQALAARAGGDPTAWRALAEANGVENPRALVPGTLLDLGPRPKGGR